MCTKIPFQLFSSEVGSFYFSRRCLAFTHIKFIFTTPVSKIIVEFIFLSISYVIAIVFRRFHSL